MGNSGRNPGVVYTFLRCATIVLVVWTLADVAGRYLELGAPGSRPGSSPAMLASIAALCIAAIAIIVATVALMRSSRTRRELDVATRALDVALRSRFEAGSGFNMKDINDAVAREVGRLAAAAGAAGKGQVTPTEPRETSLPVPHLSLVETAAEPRHGQGSPNSEVTNRLAEAISRGFVEISLRPIISLAHGAAVGFDVFAHLAGNNHEPLDIGRVRDAGGIDLAAFERMLVLETMAAWQRIAGNDGEVRLHVPISGALLGSPAEIALVLRMARVYPAAATSIVLDLPVTVLDDSSIETDVVNRLADAGISFAIEFGEPFHEATLPDLPNIGWLRLSSRWLLAAGTGREISLANMLSATGLTIIADNVESDNEAIALADIGIDLMAGPRFSGPMRLREDNNSVGQYAAE